MRKEFRLLFSSWWQMLFFVLLLVISVAMAFSVTNDSLLSGMAARDISALNGPFNEERIAQIKEKYHMDDPTKVAYGNEFDPQIQLQQIYASEYDLATERLNLIITGSGDLAAVDKAKALLADMHFYYPIVWHNFFQEFAPSPFAIPIWPLLTAALIILGANLLGEEYTLGTWLVLGKGRRAILLNKWLSLSIIGTVGTLLLHLLALFNPHNTGGLQIIGKRVAEVFNLVPLWDLSLLGTVLLNLLFWFLAVLLTVSVILLFSALFKNGFTNIIFCFLWLIVIPLALDGLFHIHPLVFPQNLIGLISITFQPNIPNYPLGTFFHWRPYLMKSPYLTIVYVILIPLVLSLLNLRLTRQMTRKWY